MSGKPEGAGWLESSVDDRYASMKNVPTDLKKAPEGTKAIGDKAGTSTAYKPNQGAADGK